MRFLGRRSVLLGRLLCFWAKFHRRLAEYLLEEGIRHFGGQHCLVFVLMDLQAVEGGLHVRVGTTAVHRDIERFEESEKGVHAIGETAGLGFAMGEDLRPQVDIVEWLRRRNR